MAELEKSGSDLRQQYINPVSIACSTLQAADLQQQIFNQSNMDDYMDDVDVQGEGGQEEEYDENADEDFNPDKATEDPTGSSSSEDDEEAAVAKTARKRKKRKSEAQIEADLDSGDEATIKALPQKKQRKHDADDEDSAGEGGFIRTRAQRMAE